MSAPCIGCGREVTLVCAGICAACLSPEALLERVSHMPEPSRSTMLRVGQGMGIIDAPTDDGMLDVQRKKRGA